jgi:Domain of unknown function (DUF4381)
VDRLPPGMHDVVDPQPVSMLPETIGWWLLLVLILGVGAWWGWQTWRRYEAQAYRRAALAELEWLAPAVRHRDPAALGELAALLKRVALHLRPRTEVAALTGEPWLRWLDSRYAGSGFSAGPGRLLLELPYRPPAVFEELPAPELAKLLELVHGWMETHA